MPDQLLVIRHGETEWSRTGRHTGRTDLPLTDRGRDEARDAARTLLDWRIDHVAASPLARARETAELVGLEPPIVIDHDLVEWDYGDFEGERTVDTRRSTPDWSVWTHPITGGESVEDVGDRVDAFLGRIDGLDGNVAVFAHGHLLAVLIARWCGLRPVEGRRFALATATVSLLGHHREDRVVRAINHRCGDALHPPSRA
ncbi:MAG: histidine phosphatase family protein [Actinomycetota bacterium]